MSRRLRALQPNHLLKVVAAGLLIGAMLAPVQAQAWTSTESRTYSMGDVGPHPIGVQCGIGKVCFGRPLGSRLSVSISDNSGRTVGGVLYLTSETVRLTMSFCGSIQNVPVMGDRLDVYLDAPGDVEGLHWDGGPGCREIHPTGGWIADTTAGATSGQVTVTYTG